MSRHEIDLHAWIATVKDLHRARDSRLRLIVERDTAHAAEQYNHHGGTLTSSLSEVAQQAANRVTADCRQRVTAFATSKRPALAAARRERLDEALATATAFTEALRAFEACDADAAAFLRLAQQPALPPTGHNADLRLFVEDFMRRVALVREPRPTATRVSRPALAAPDYADIVG